MRRFAAFATAFTALLAFAPPAVEDAGAYQHVTNGSFESGMDAWITSAPATITTDTATDGTHSARLGPGDAAVELTQQIDAALGAGSYTLSADVLTEAPALAHLTLDTSAGVIGTQANTLPASWTPISLSVHLAAAGTARIKIKVVGGLNAPVYIDDVRIEGAPPVTFTPTVTATPPAATPEASGTAAHPTVTPTPPVQDAVAPYLRNSGFEEIDASGLPVAWHKYGGVLSAVTSPVRDGARAARLTSDTDSTKWLYQTVLVDAGATYEFGAWVLHDDAGAREAFLRVSWYASEDGSGTAIGAVDSPEALEEPSPQFRPLSTGPVTAPGGALSAKLRVMLAPRSSAPASIVVDEAWWHDAVPPAPTPAPPVRDDAGITNHAGASERRASAVRASGRSRTIGNGRVDVDGARSDAAAILINEVLYDAAGEVPDAEGEWIEFYNRGTVPVSLAGWSIQDNARRTMLPDIVVQPGTFAVVSASSAFLEEYPRFSGTWASTGGRLGNGLGNDGDLLELVAPDGTLADAVSWGADASVFDPAIDDVPAGHSIERRAAGTDTDRASDFVDNHSPSPGAPLPPIEEDAAASGNGRTIEVLEGKPAPNGWVPWMLVALSAAAFVAALGWRAYDSLRHRTPAA